ADAEEGLADFELALPEAAPIDDLGLPADFDLSLEDEPAPAVEPVSFAAQLEDVTAELDQLAGSLESSDDGLPPAGDVLGGELDGDDDFDFLSGTDETAT